MSVEQTVKEQCDEIHEALQDIIRVLDIIMIGEMK